MKSLKYVYDSIIDFQPHWSTYICFCETVRGRRFNKMVIRRWFNKLVDKEDYDKKDKRMIIDYFFELSSRRTEYPYVVPDINKRNRLKDCGISSVDYDMWKRRCLIRDRHKCQICGSDERVEVHHIYRFIDEPQLAIDMANGVSLCHKCHKEVHRKKIENKLQEMLEQKDYHFGSLVALV